jgi:hypothetical protein
MAVHLCGNPGISSDFIKYATEILKAKPYKKENHIPSP